MPSPEDSHRRTTKRGQPTTATTPARPVARMARYGRVAEHAPLAIAMTAGRTHQLCVANPAFCRLLGVEAVTLRGQSLVDALPASDTDHMRVLLDDVYNAGGTAHAVGRQPTPADHTPVAWIYYVWSIPDHQGRPTGLVVLILETTASHRDEQAMLDVRAINAQLLLVGLREQALVEQLQRQLATTNAITHSLGEGLYALDRAGRFTMVNPAAARMLGWTERELLGRGVHEVIYGQIATGARRMEADSLLLAVMRSGTAARDEHALWTRRDRTGFATAYSAAPIVTDGQIVGAVVAFRDMTDARAVELTLARQATELARSHAELEHLFTEVQALALTDELTGLYNRRGFFTLAAQQLKIAKRTNQALSLVFIDLDGLKYMNDRWGHQVGSEALTMTARILTAVFRESDIIARVGGDEFAVLAVDSDAQDLDKVLQRVRRQCAQHNMQANVPYQLSVSMGVAHSTVERPCSLEALLEQADAQMYAHKQTKRTRRSVSPIPSRDR